MLLGYSLLYLAVYRLITCVAFCLWAARFDGFYLHEVAASPIVPLARWLGFVLALMQAFDVLRLEVLDSFLFSLLASGGL